MSRIASISKQIALRCRISRGAFSDELVFELNQSDKTPYVGAASRQYFWTRNNEKLKPDGPENEAMDGIVAARLLSKDNDLHTAIVAIPDGEVISVEQYLIEARPPEAESDVPLESGPALGD